MQLTSLPRLPAVLSEDRALACPPPAAPLLPNGGSRRGRQRRQ